MGGTGMATEKHLALFYQDREHQKRAMIPFFSECLEQDLKVLYITSDETTRWIDDFFSALTTSSEIQYKDQQIKAWTAESVYLREGNLNFESILRILQREDKRAESEGFNGLSFCLEVTHILLKLYSLSSFKTFMNALNMFLSGNNRILFLYQSSIIEAVSLMQILTAHPYIAVQEEFIKNPYYTAPEKNPAHVFFTYLMQNHEYLDTISENRDKIREITASRDRFEDQWRTVSAALEEAQASLTSSEQSLKEKSVSEENFRHEVERLARLSSEQAESLSLLEERTRRLVENEQTQNQETQRVNALLSEAEAREKEQSDRMRLLENENQRIQLQLDNLEREKTETESKFSAFFQEKAQEITALEESQMKERIEWNEVKRDLEDRLRDLAQQSLREKGRFDEEIAAYTRSFEQLETEIGNEKSRAIESEIEQHRLEALLTEKEETLNRCRQEDRALREQHTKEREEWTRKIKVFEDQLALGLEESLRKEKALKEALASKTEQENRMETLMLEASMAKTECAELAKELEQVKALHHTEAEARLEYELKAGAWLSEKKRLDTENEEFRQAIDSFTKQVEALTAKAEELETEKRMRKEEHTGFIEKIAQLTEQIERESQIKSELELFCEDARTQSENTRKELEAALQTIRDLNAQKEQLLQQQENGKSEITTLFTRIREAEEAAERKRKCLGELKQKVEQQETAELRLKKELEEANKALEESRSDFERLNEKELENRDRVEHLKIQLAQEENLFQEVQKDIFSYKAQISILEERIKDKETQVQEKESVFVDLTRLIESLKAENEEIREKYRQVYDLKNRLETLLAANGFGQEISPENEKLLNPCVLGVIPLKGNHEKEDEGKLPRYQASIEERDREIKRLEESNAVLQKEREELLSLLEVADAELKKVQTPDRDFG